MEINSEKMKLKQVPPSFIYISSPFPICLPHRFFKKSPTSPTQILGNLIFLFKKRLEVGRELFILIKISS